MSAAVCIRVPGSTSNLGGGFDCVGMAIDRRLSARVRLEPSRGLPPRIERGGTLRAVSVPPERDFLSLGFAAACRGAGCAVPQGVVIEATSDVPVGRGLGSSGAAVVAGALAARALLGLKLDDETLARLCADVEGHPDNVVPAIYGGAVLAARGPDGRLAVAPLDVHESLVFVFAVPDFEVETERARAALPPVVPHATAAARAAGAFGATLSGSASAILAVTPAPVAAGVAETMARAWRGLGIAAEAFALTRPGGGCEVVSLIQETVPCPSP